MKIIIPMAGLGSRFATEGYPDPKPFISVNGKPMIKRVVESVLQFEHEHIFLVRAEHLARYDFNAIFPHLSKFRVIPVHNTTAGAALTVALAQDCIHTSEEILIVNSDQLVEYNHHELDEVRYSGIDGCIWCFNGTGTNWSYARLDSEGYVVEVAEKKQISEYATGGMYYWRQFGDFMNCVTKMIEADDRTNNEFYVAPAYNHMGEDKKVIIKMLDSVDQLGTPTELRAYEDKIRLSRNN